MESVVIMMGNSKESGISNFKHHKFMQDCPPEKARIQGVARVAARPIDFGYGLQGLQYNFKK